MTYCHENNNFMTCSHVFRDKLSWKWFISWHAVMTFVTCCHDFRDKLSWKWFISWHYVMTFVTCLHICLSSTCVNVIWPSVSVQCYTPVYSPNRWPLPRHSGPWMLELHTKPPAWQVRWFVWATCNLHIVASMPWINGVGIEGIACSTCFNYLCTFFLDS